jgi:hypothetical protein
MGVRGKQIIESPLLVVQKIDAVKTFLLPSLDFMLLNGDVGEKQLEEMDKHVRALINKALKARTLLTECHHPSWRDGEMSYPSLVDRRRVLMVRSLGQMILSKEIKVREAMRWFVNEERDYRGIGVDPESSFLDWKDEKGRPGTAALVGRTRTTCKKMKIGMKLIKDEMGLKGQELEYKTKTAVGIGRFLTQKILRPDKIEKLIQHPCHGASFTTLKSNEVSNSMLTNVSTRHTHAFFRFMIVGRVDCLPTPAN